MILDEVQIAVGLFGILGGLVRGTEWTDMLTGFLIGGGFGLALKYGFLYFRHKDGLGLGDVKFLAVAGVWLADGMSFVPFLFFSGLLGVVCGLAWRARGLGERFPFGPALAASLFLCVALPQTARDFWDIYGLLR